MQTGSDLKQYLWLTKSAGFINLVYSNTLGILPLWQKEECLGSTGLRTSK